MVSAWWREIVNICDGVGSTLGSWFPNNLCLKVDNGISTFFGLIGGLVMSLFELDFVAYLI